jgi:hypothetical protein
MCTVHKLYAFIDRSVLAFVDFGRFGASQTGSSVTIRWCDHGFLCVLSTHYLSNTHRLKVTRNLLIVNYGGMSISTARGHLRLEIRSPVDRMITVFCSCFVDNYRLSCNVSTLQALFLMPETAERRFWPLRSVLVRK